MDRDPACIATMILNERGVRRGGWFLRPLTGEQGRFLGSIRVGQGAIIEGSHGRNIDVVVNHDQSGPVINLFDLQP